MDSIKITYHIRENKVLKYSIIGILSLILGLISGISSLFPLWLPFFCLGILVLLFIVLAQLVSINQLIMFSFMGMLFFLPFQELPQWDLGVFTLKLSQFFLFLILIISIIRLLLRFKDGKVYYIKTPVDLPILFFALSTIAACYYSTYLNSSLRMIIVLLLLFVAYQVTYHLLDDKEKINKAINIILLSSSTVSLYGIHQYLMHFLGKGGRVWFYSSALGDLIPKIESVSNPNQFSNYLLVCIPLTITMLFYEKKGFKKTILITVTLINLLALMLTYSRGAILGLFSALAVLFIYQKTKIMKLIKIVLFTLLLVWILNFLVNWHSLNIRIASIFDLASEANQERITLHKTALTMLAEHPIIGVGIGNFRFLFSLERPIDIHNTLLQIWVENGTIGLIFFIWILERFFRNMVKALKITKDIYWRGIILGITASAVGIFVQSVTEYILYAMHVWVLLGIGLAVCRVSSTTDKQYIKSNLLK